MLDKKLKRRRRATKTRAHIRRLGVARLCIARSLKHIYAQVIIYTDKSDHVVASASTLDQEVREKGGVSNNIQTASIVGTLAAERALKAGITKVAFDRSGFKYHGRVKALAQAARDAGLSF